MFSNIVNNVKKIFKTYITWHWNETYHGNVKRFQNCEKIMEKNIWNIYCMALKETCHEFVFDFAMILKNIVKVTDYIFKNYIFLFQFSSWMYFSSISRTICFYYSILPYINHISLWHYYSYFLVYFFQLSLFVIHSLPFFLSSHFILLSVGWIYTEKLYLCLIHRNRTVTYNKIFSIFNMYRW